MLNSGKLQDISEIFLKFMWAEWKEDLGPGFDESAIMLFFLISFILWIIK